MKRFLIPLLAALALPTAVNANVDPEVAEVCMKAADYKGCVELNTKKSSLPKCNWIRKDNCLGEIKYDNGIYVGEILNKEANGQGVFTWANGDKYTGEFKDNKFYGFGTFIYNDGTKYIGQFENGSPNGKGKLTFASGDIYEGEFKGNKFHGKGVYKSIDGSSYVGGYKDGKFQGKGVYKSIDGSIYNGGFKDGKVHGIGTKTWADGDRYTGEFVNGNRSGQGTFVWGEESQWFGDSYVGQFKNGERHGQGTYFYKDGSSWSGEWKDGKRIEIEGNACPQGFAYSGNGDCRQVTCVMGQLNHFDLGGKDHACGNAPFWSGYIGRMTLDWDSKTVPAEYDPKCPAKPPEIGWRSSCTQALGSDVIPLYVGGVPPKKKNKTPLACRNGTWSPNHPKCKK